MNFNFSGIILSDRLFATEDLVEFSKNKLEHALPDWEKGIYEFILDFLSDDDYIEQTSSGTTGKPKKFRLHKKALIESATRTCDILGLKFGDKTLLCLPIEYIAGKMMVVRAFVAGLNLFWEEPTSMPAVANYGKLDFCAMVPLQVYNSFSNYEFINNIKNLIIGGGELRSELLAMFIDVNNRTYETYGMAETCSHVALRKISGKNPDKYFKAIPGVEFSVDERNCLKIKAEYIDHEIQTNDVVELIDNSNFIWRGRYDNLINTGGIKVKPEELEAEIAKVLDMDFAIIGLPDPKLGQAITLVVEARKPYDEFVLKGLLMDVLPSYHLPKKYCFVDKLPRNASFKIDRDKIVELVKA